MLSCFFRKAITLQRNQTGKNPREHQKLLNLIKFSSFPLTSLGERYVYKFVCVPEALFQMALAENHRNALKAEAASVLKASNVVVAEATNNEVTHGGAGNINPNAGEHHPHSHHHHRSRHQYSDMLNQVYTSHLSAQLQGGGGTQHNQHDGGGAYAAAFPALDPAATKAAESLAESLVDKDGGMATSFQAFAQPQQHLDYSGYGGADMLGAAYGGAQQVPQRYHPGSAAAAGTGGSSAAATSQYLSYYRHQLSAVVHCGAAPPLVPSAVAAEVDPLAASSGGLEMVEGGKTAEKVDSTLV